MALNLEVRFYSFSKRTNSTKQPTGAYTSIKCCLKDNTSILSPELVLSGNLHTTYNYAYIPDWNRYYFVDESTSDAAGLTTLQLSEDYLATWKSAVNSTVAHVVYSSTGYYKDIIDPRITQYTTKQWQTASENDTNMGGGCFILNTLSKDGSNNGFHCSYLFNATDIKTLANWVLGLNVGSWISQAVYQPLDCIVSCKWYPLQYDTIKTSCCTIGQMYLGAADIGSQGYIVTTPVLTGGVTFNLTPRYNDFRRLSASDYSLFIPYGGVFPVAQDEIVATNGALHVNYYLDLTTGSMLVMESDGTNMFNMFEIGFGVDCPIAAVQGGNINNFLESAVGSVAGVITSAMSGNVSGMVGAAATGVAGMTQEVATKRYRSRGTQGSRAYTYQGTYFRLIENASDTEDPTDANYIARQGRPVFETHALSNHSGYIQCDNASVAIAGFDTERESVNNYLNSGFYLE